MIIMGVDPSLANTGVVVYDTVTDSIICMETIKTKRTDDIGHQWEGFRDLVRSEYLISQLNCVSIMHQPGVICGEVPAGAQDANAAKALGIATCLLGSLAYDATVAGSLFLPTKPTWVKADTIGKEKAKENRGNKRVMIDWAYNKFPDAPWKIHKSTGLPMANQEHVADAIAIIYSALFRKFGEYPEYLR